MMGDEKDRIYENAEDISETTGIPVNETAEDYGDRFLGGIDTTVKRSPDKKKKYIYIAISAVISVALWLNVVDIQNPDLKRTIRNVPLTVRNMELMDEQNLEVTSDINAFVSVTIKGRRGDIININASEVEAELNLGECTEGINDVDVIVKVPDSVILDDVKPGKMEVSVERRIEEDKDIEIIFDGSLMSGREPVCIDQSDKKVRVSGVKSLVDSVEKVMAVVKIKELENYKEKYEAELIPVDKQGKTVENVSLSKKTVEIHAMINVTKKVKLLVDTTGRLPNGVELQDISYPAEIEIVAPEEQVGSIERIIAAPIDLSGITGNITIDLELDMPEGIRLSRNQLKPQAVIKAGTKDEKTISINSESIQVLNLNPEMKMVYQNDHTDVTVAALLDRLSDISEENISLTIDCAELKEGSHVMKPSADIVDVENKEEYELFVSEIMVELIESKSDEDISEDTDISSEEVSEQ